MTDLPRAFTVFLALATLWLTTDRTPAQQEPEAPAARLEVRSGSLSVEAHWAQIADSTYKLHEKAKAFRFQPAARRKDYGAETFRGFLPSQPVQVGSTWRVAPDVYREFLQQFHSGVKVVSDGRGLRVAGGWACLRAISQQFAEVAIRVHADFEIRKHEAYYNPAQFAGTLILDLEQKKVEAFRLALPARNSNADIQAKLDGHRWMAADIVYVPRMELVGGTFPDDLEWDREISMEDARERLAKRFYGFANIDWIPFDRVREEARRTGRPMHIMVLFGTLDDESC